MIKSLPDAFEPWVGLSGIVATEDDSAQRLPDDARLQPIEAAVEAQLRAMLQADTIDALILEAVKPMALDCQVLAPARFHALREEVMTTLAALQARAHGEELAELTAATALLRARTREHELGETLRYALLKG